MWYYPLMNKFFLCIMFLTALFYYFFFNNKVVPNTPPQISQLQPFYNLLDMGGDGGSNKIRYTYYVPNVTYEFFYDLFLQTCYVIK